MMLSGLFHEFYQEFYHALQQLQAIATQAHPDRPALQAAFLEAQQLFQLRIMALDLEGLPVTAQSQVQSYQTEINKQLRLLGMDVMFLQAARQSTTAQQRQAQMIDRIKTLLRYCDALLKPDQAEPV
jgi:hypothetical protein